MTGADWLGEVAARVREHVPLAEISTPDEDLTTIMAGLRGVVIHLVGESVMVAPSASGGTTIAERLEHRVQHFDALAYAISPATLDEAARAIVKHLGSTKVTTSSS